jgi:lincosamide nucleotidyltransferase A/C/D/E
MQIIIKFMTSDEAIYLYRLMEKYTIPAWIIGGWGIDALLGEQTRPHKDLDILVLVDDVARLLALLESEGFHFAYLWEENTFVPDSQGRQTATAFVWKNDAGPEIDAHAMQLDAHGSGIPAWTVLEGFLFPREDLAAQGVIDGVPVRCISARMQMACHTGYDLPDAHRKDMERLQNLFTDRLAGQRPNRS